MKLTTKTTEDSKFNILSAFTPILLIVIFAIATFKPTTVDVEIIVEKSMESVPAHIKNSTIESVSTTRFDNGFDIEMYRAIIITFEQDERGYQSENPDTHAYGLYQFIPSTAIEVYKRCGLNNDPKSDKYWKLPQNQDIMFYNWTEERIRGLMRRGIEVTYTNVWVGHNMGLRGVTEITTYIKDGKSKVSKSVVRNMKANPPFVESNGRRLHSIKVTTAMDYYYGWDVLVQHRLDSMS